MTETSPAVGLAELAARCSDILEWKSSGLLTGTALRDFSNTERFARYGDNRIDQAERATVNDVLRLVVGLNAAIRHRSQSLSQGEATVAFKALIEDMTLVKRGPEGVSVGGVEEAAIAIQMSAALQSRNGRLFGDEALLAIREAITRAARIEETPQGVRIAGVDEAAAAIQEAITCLLAGDVAPHPSITPEKEVDPDDLSHEQMSFLLFMARINGAGLAAKGATAEIIEAANSLVELGLSENRRDGRWLTPAGQRLIERFSEPAGPSI